MPICIGDVHGKYSGYKAIIKEYQNTIQVGDMGVGFKNAHGDIRGNPPFDLMLESGARFIRGNHDNPEECRKHQMNIKDGTVEDDIMFCGGAFSIDKLWRTEGYTWWPDEELNDEQFRVVQGIYIVTKPNCMITHDCPRSLYEKLHDHHFDDDPSRTSLAFQAMLEVYRPKVWVFGHHHISFDEVIDGTRFVCLAELEAKEITWDK